jgi:hypothetical protein
MEFNRRCTQINADAKRLQIAGFDSVHSWKIREIRGG